MAEKFNLPMDRITEFCQINHIRRLSIFGSILRDDFNADSDIDFLVTFEESAIPGLMGLSRMRQELQNIVGREVDLISQRGVENSRNPIRRKRILESAKLIYEA